MLGTTALLDHHPDVDIIWNIFPLNLVVLSAFRVPLNFFFFWLYIPFMWTWWLWNLFWETLTFGAYTLVNIPWLIVNAILIFASFLIIPIPLLIISVLLEFGFASYYINTITLNTILTYGIAFGAFSAASYGILSAIEGTSSKSSSFTSTS